ncbi:MAG: DNA-directed RNA polymerase, subunit E'' [Candidatus Marsarchaeota archaeon]|jgi:DNA-directed RNA polymerase subunit E"|nr:DNA-directed RNA polymerase, subunit E'' [Candidatus Marsarchaeota archaeon]
MPDQACKNCRFIVMQGGVCPICGSNQLTTKWSGMVVVLNVEKSEIAKKLGIKMDGSYAINING